MGVLGCVSVSYWPGIFFSTQFNLTELTRSRDEFGIRDTHRFLYSQILTHGRNEMLKIGRNRPRGGPEGALEAPKSLKTGYLALITSNAPKKG